MGQAESQEQGAAAISTKSDGPVGVTSATAPSIDHQPLPPAVRGSVSQAGEVTGRPATATDDVDDDDVGDMSAAHSCHSVNLRQSLNKMRWTASSLEALRAAEGRLLVSTAVSSTGQGGRA